MSGRGRRSFIAHLPQLEFLQSLFEIADISSSITDIAVNSSLDRRIAGGLSHVICGIDESLLSFYLLVDVRNGVIGVRHLDSVLEGAGDELSQLTIV